MCKVGIQTGSPEDPIGWSVAYSYIRKYVQLFAGMRSRTHVNGQSRGQTISRVETKAKAGQPRGQAKSSTLIKVDVGK